MIGPYILNRDFVGIFNYCLKVAKNLALCQEWPVLFTKNIEPV
jgi:hypothetical protein